MAAENHMHITPDHPILPVVADRWSPYAYDPPPSSVTNCCRAWKRPAGRRRATTSNPGRSSSLSAGTLPLSIVYWTAWSRATAHWAQNAGVLIVTVVSKLFAKNGKPNRAAEHDMGLAAGNFVLQATALELQAHQMIGIESTKVRETYRVPENYEPLTAIALGYPASIQPGTTDALAQRATWPAEAANPSPILSSVLGARARTCE